MTNPHPHCVRKSTSGSNLASEAVWFIALQANQPEAADWDKGLPRDVLALIARLGGITATQSMRAVSKSWQEGFELAVEGIEISLLDPVPSGAGEAARRFPGLTSLDMGCKLASPSWLAGIGAFRKLSHLALGERFSVFTVHDATSPLQKVHFADLSMGGSSCELFPAGLSCLQGLPITHLKLRSLNWVTLDDLWAFRCMPLASLDLSYCGGPMCDAGLERLRGLPLTSLRLVACPVADAGVTDAGLAALVEMSLARLCIEGCKKITGDGLEFLRGMPLTQLELIDCVGIEGLGALEGMPITSLVLAGIEVFVRPGFSYRNIQMSADVYQTVSLEPLRKLPNLNNLALKYMKGLGYSHLPALEGLSLTSLDLEGCSRVVGNSLDVLRTMPLFELNLSGCHNVSLEDRHIFEGQVDDRRHEMGLPATVPRNIAYPIELSNYRWGLRNWEA